MGYTHCGSTVYRFLKRLERSETAPTAPVSKQTVPSRRHVASLLVQQPERLTDDEQAYLTRLGEQAPTVATAYALIEAFAGMLR